MSRLLGLDLGERRIGVAIVGGADVVPRPLATIRRAAGVAQDATTLARLVRDTAVTELVVGLPLEASGAEGPMAAAARAWATAIGDALGLPVVLRDERLSSVRADARLGPPRRGRSGGPPTARQREVRRSRVDREAAAIILEDEMEARMRDRR